MSSSSFSHFTALLNLCSKNQNEVLPKKLHCFLLRNHLLPHTALANNLITAYSRTRIPHYARKVFDGIPHPNTFSWNALLSAYKSLRISDMEDVFKSMMPLRDAVSWNCLISGYVAHGSMEDRAIEVYRSMLRDGFVYPNRITLAMMLAVGSAPSQLALCLQLHCHVIKLGFGSNAFVGSPLLDMYSKAGLITEAQLVFDGMEKKNLVVYNTMITAFMRCGMVEDAKTMFASMRERDRVSWSAVLAGLTRNGLVEEAIGFFRRMRVEVAGMDQYAFGSVLTACGSVSALQQGKQVHAYAIRMHSTGNVFVGSALVDMYSKCRNC